jgi:hypothetical protein
MLSDYSLPGHHLHQGNPPGLCLCNSYTRDFDIVLFDYSLPGQHLHQGVPPGLRLSDSYTRGYPHQGLCDEVACERDSGADEL